jgi:hypothetical protein
MLALHIGLTFVLSAKATEEKVVPRGKALSAAR